MMLQIFQVLNVIFFVDFWEDWVALSSCVDNFKFFEKFLNFFEVINKIQIQQI